MAEVFSSYKVPENSFLSARSLDLAMIPMTSLSGTTQTDTEVSPVPVVTVVPTKPSADGAGFRGDFEKFREMSSPTLLDDKRDRALKRWHLFMSTSPEAFGAESSKQGMAPG